MNSTKDLKVGDVVLLRKDLTVGIMYGNFTFLDSLKQPEVTISRIVDDTQIRARNKNSCSPEREWYYDVKMLLKKKKPIKPIKNLTRILNDIHK